MLSVLVVAIYLSACLSVSILCASAALFYVQFTCKLTERDFIRKAGVKMHSLALICLWRLWTGRKLLDRKRDREMQKGRQNRRCHVIWLNAWMPRWQIDKMLIACLDANRLDKPWNSPLLDGDAKWQRQFLSAAVSVRVTLISRSLSISNLVFYTYRIKVQMKYHTKPSTMKIVQFRWEDTKLGQIETFISFLFIFVSL